MIISPSLKQDDIYMYGGKIETNTGNVTDELWIFNIPSQTWSLRIPAVLVHGQQYAVEGHSAHIVELDSRDVIMLVIFGYSVIYGYTSSVQEYYISKLLFCFLNWLFKISGCEPLRQGIIRDKLYLYLPPDIFLTYHRWTPFSLDRNFNMGKK